MIFMLDAGAVKHDSHNPYYRSPFGAVASGTKVKFALSLRTRVSVQNVILRCWTDRDRETLIPLKTTDEEGAEIKYYQTVTEMPGYGCLLWYYFIISTEEGTVFYGNNMEHLGGMGDVYESAPPSYQITVYRRGAKTPDWFKHSVMYQIFPDRFYREGNAIVKKKGAVYHADWTDDPCYYKDPDTKEIVAYDFFGGNLKGIEKKLDYLKTLGITVLYLNPVFKSESNHRYDTGDYHKIDPILGTNEDFHHLVHAAREKGMRIILDGVFSHTGSNSRYFNRYGQYDTVGAFQSKESPYYNWYDFRNFPYEYECWWNFDTLPNVKETTPSYMDFIIHDKDSVLHHWLREGIGGWRLDVIDELPATFSQAFFKELKAANSDAVMLGEVWEDCSNKVAYGQQRQYLCGDEMDSAMNYPLRAILFDYLLGRNDGSLTMRRFESLRENYPAQNFYAMMNLIGSHDVERALSVLGEAVCYEGMPAVDQSRSRLSDEQYAVGLKRLYMATLFQMTYPGVPSVYYGDEMAMQGFKDPYNRRPFPWQDKVHEDVHHTFAQMICTRNAHMALQTGALLPLTAEGDIIAYARVIEGGHDMFGEDAKDEVFVALFNRSTREKHAVTVDVSDFADGTFCEVFHKENTYETATGKLSVKMPPLTGMLLEHCKKPRHYERKAGILLHPTSLPSKYGCGDFGKCAYDFVDFLAAAGQKIWQILPLNPVGYGYSPYQSPSAFAGNTVLIDIDDLVDKKWLMPAEARIADVSAGSFVDFERVENFKTKAFQKAYRRFQQDDAVQPAFAAFCKKESYWLEDYALFQAGKRENRGKPWTAWSAPLKKRKGAALKDLSHRYAEHIGYVKFLQFVFAKQWQRLHGYARSKGVEILGDMPIFISHDSSDVWAHRELFDLEEDGTAKTVAGVPPDYFSATGQLWGNPHYNWQAMEKDGWDWWIRRFRKLYENVDIIRIDHFRGFEAYWEVDGKAETAINGKWKKGPGKKFFDAMKDALGKTSIIVEDLGVITDEVEKLRDDCEFPGMKVLQFSLHMNDYGRMGFVAPENCIVCTGTHDNNTTVGWFTGDLDEMTRASVASLVHAPEDRPDKVAAKLISFAYASNARMAIIPMQDILHLDERARMNIPGTVGPNWKWCLRPDYRLQTDADWLKELCIRYER